MNQVRRTRRIAMHKLARIFRERKRQPFIQHGHKAGETRLAGEQRRGWARPAHTGLKPEPGNP